MYGLVLGYVWVIYGYVWVMNGLCVGYECYMKSLYKVLTNCPPFSSAESKQQAIKMAVIKGVLCDISPR
jgi:hypothetical protein